MRPADSSPAVASGLEVRLFGAFAVLRNREPVAPLRTRKGASLLALLVLRASQAVDRSLLAGLLWPDSEPDQAGYNFRRCLSDLRGVLGSEASRLRAGERPQTLVLDIDGLNVDVLAFDEAVTRGDIQSLQTAASLYRGPLLEGCVDEWVFPERRAREHAVVEALERLGRDASQREDWASAERYLRRGVELDPLRETTQRELMQALNRGGAPAAALQCFRELRRLLATELRTEPAPETVALFRDIRAAVRFEDERPPRRATGPSLAEAPQSNLPHPPTGFVGREGDIRHLRERLAQVRLLTLIGAGGVGKTRLAIRVAEEMTADFDDEIWFVDLAPLSDATQVTRAVATVLGVREEPRRPLIETLCSALSTRKLLLILDNCEHLVPACATLVTAFLTHCSQLHVCATSRQALGVAGETTWRVPSLTVPDPLVWSTSSASATDQILRSEAVRLFVARAMECCSDFHVSASAVRAIAEVCARLDGIPLAIELAAVRTRVLSVEEIATRLHDRFGLLTEGNRIVLTRHQTLRATLDWSYGLLDAKQQMFLRWLSCFAGSATLEAAHAICARGIVERDEVLDLVTALVDRSLVVVERDVWAGSRYDLLETVRAYGRSLLQQSGEAEDMGRDHASFFLELAIDAEPHLSGPEQVGWLDRLELEHPNLRVALTFFIERDPVQALRMAVALALFWEARGYFAEGRRWLQKALARCPDASPVLRARALAGAGRLAFCQADSPNGRLLLEQGLSLLDSIKERRLVITMLGTLSQLAVGEGDYVRARELGERAVAEARTLGDAHLLASQLRDFELVVGTGLDFAMAKAINEEALGLWRALGNGRGIARAQMGLGMSHFYSGDALTARRHFLEGLAVSRDVGDNWLTCAHLLGLGHVARALGEMAAALGSYGECLTLNYTANSSWGVHVFEAMASLAASEGFAAKAAQLYGVSEAIRQAQQLPLFPFMEPEHEAGVAAARASLGAEAFAAAWARGRDLPLDQAVALALSRDDKGA